MTRFYDPLLGRLVVMNFDFGQAMTKRAAALAVPEPVAGDDFSHAMPGDMPSLFHRLIVAITGQGDELETPK